MLQNISQDIWHSFRRMPFWVQIWVAVILVPINLLTLLFWYEPYGHWVSLLAVGGMLPNVLIMALDRGFSKAMALSHVVLWLPLCGLCVYLLIQALNGSLALSTSYLILLCLLLTIDVISLFFDIPDSIKWLKGDRSVA